MNHDDPSEQEFEAWLNSLSRDQLLEVVRQQIGSLPSWEREKLVRGMSAQPPRPSPSRLRLLGPMALTSLIAVLALGAASFFILVRKPPAPPFVVEVQTRSSASAPQVAVSAGADLVEPKVRVRLRLATPDVQLMLVTGEDVQLIPPELYRGGSITILLEQSKKHRIDARKDGYEPLSVPLVFEQGEQERTVDVELRPASAVASSTPAPAASATASGAAPAGASQESARLNINSIPPTSVLIDGRPAGRTPKAGVEVAPGEHTVTLIHPELGRKTVVISTRSGETKTVAVRF